MLTSHIRRHRMFADITTAELVQTRTAANVEMTAVCSLS